MATELSFLDMIAALGDGRLAGSGRTSFQVMTGEDFFVEPQLQLREEFGELDGSVLLVSARGAAGKSRVAEELSRRVRAPLWKLEEDKAVSGTSLSFSLGQYLGVADVPGALANASNTPLVLVDSLDEARARVSATSWSEFLESLADFARHGCRFVLFGRERTLEEVWLSLSDLDIEAAWLEISHFGRAERCQYVDGVVRGRSGVKTIQGSHYQAARDAVLSSLVSSVSGDSAETFAGYAPVLDAVAAVLLREENHFAVSRTFGSPSPGTRQLEELRRVLDSLLERDQRKMGPLAGDLGLDPAVVYSPNEQIKWLCHVLERGPEPDLSHIGDLKVRSNYIERIRPFVDDHPFRSEARWASTVFAAYTASKLFGTSISGRRLVEIGNDSSLLFDFVALEPDVMVDEWGFAALHASITAGEFGGASASVAASEVHDDEYDVTMSVLNAGSPYEKGFTLVTDAQKLLHLYGPLESLTVTTSGMLAIPARETPTVLGPDAFLRCSALSIDGPSVEFAHRATPATVPGDSDGVVTIEVTSPDIRLPAAITRDPRPGSFELRVLSETTLFYPWVGYRETLELPEQVSIDDRVIRFLNMFMNLTRSHGHPGERGAFIKKFQGRQALKGADFQAAVRILVEHGIARLGSEMIYLCDEYEPQRFSGKTLQGQRLIADVWDFWGPIVAEISERIR